MRKNEIEKLTCSVARTIGAIGERWTLLLLREFFLGSRRFEVLQAHTGMSSRALSDRLERLQHLGVITAIAYQERPPRYEYRLTDKGMELYPVIVSMTRWGDRWMRAKAEPPPARLVHRDCGNTFKPMLTCASCGEATGARDVRVDVGPEMSAERRVMQDEFFAAVSRKTRTTATRRRRRNRESSATS
jgi:DNA-binding HxlR family transcriptional regulator